MEVSFDPELAATPERIAAETGRPRSQVVVDLVANQIDHDAWFRREVQKGVLSIDRGKYVEDAEVDARLDQMLQS
jgi:predicted transcriptional regulator